MRRAIFIALLLIMMISGSIGYKYRRVILAKVKTYWRSSPGLNQGNSHHLEEGSCIAKNNRLNLPKQKLSQLSSVSGLKPISSNKHFHIDSMTHSKPLLTKQGKNILHTIASDFQNSLEAKGYKKKKIVITSMTRSAESQKQLSKKNINATSQSAHLYGSTFDISYRRFKDVSNSAGKDPNHTTLVKTLEETLTKLKNKGELVGIKEYKQPCFHITASCTQ